MKLLLARLLKSFGAVGPRRAWDSARDGKVEVKEIVRTVVLRKIRPNRIVAIHL